jgi:parallel beta-helix repeat protein
LIKKTLVLGILILILFGVNACNISGKEIDMNSILSVSFDGDILYVGGSGPNNYTTIQSAIDDADDGDTVYVFNGTYNDHVDHYCVFIDKSINLLGENKYNTIIDATGNIIGVKVFVGGVKVSGFTITSATDGTGRGVEVDNLGFTFTNVNISDNIITQNDWGFHNEVCENCILYNNIITNNNEIGIHEYGDLGTTIIDNNEITNNPIGISIGWTEKPTIITHNHIEGNDYGISISLTGRCIIMNNNFINNTIDSHILIGPYLLGSLVSLYRNRWDGNYWDTWQRPTPKPILGFFLRAIIIPIPGAHFIMLPIGIFPFIRFDWHPVSEPYDIGE